MKTILQLLLVATTIHADSLTIVEAEPSNVTREKSKMLQDTLQANIPKARLSLQDVSLVIDPATQNFLPDGQVFRVSAVVMDPVTRHGALVNFVIYEHGNKQIVMPMSGSHTEFAGLLNLTGKKINDKNDALAISRGYAALYGIKADAEPEINFDGNRVVIRILQNRTPRPDDKQNIIELKVDVDQQRNADKVEAKIATNIIKKQMKVAKKLTLEAIEKINNTINEKPSLAADPEIQIKTPDEAFDRINTSMSMASPPEVYAEDASFYYFSGGLATSRTDDFSSGIRISKNGGAIHVWPRAK